MLRAIGPGEPAFDASTRARSRAHAHYARAGTGSEVGSVPV